MAQRYHDRAKPQEKCRAALSLLAGCPIQHDGDGYRSCSLRAIVNEKPVARPDEVLRMRGASIFAIKIYLARILQIVVEAFLRQMVDEKLLPYFNLPNIRFASSRISIL